MTKKIIVLFFLISFLLTSKTIFADDTTDLSNKIAEYTQKLNQLGTAKNTLSNQIKILDSQVELTLLKIAQTENTIKTLEKEINGLTTEIDKLNINLNDLSIVYINQIVQNYKLQKKVPEFAYIFSSKLNDFLEQHKYITILQKDSQNNLIKMETIRTNYDLQKTSKEKKQAELEELKKTLASQKISLNNQKSAKNNLLEATKNDEKKYQQLLDEAVAQLNAFRNFVSSNGGASLLSDQTKCNDWGCYFNQRDSKWGNMSLGSSTVYDMKNYGCLITSSTMILNHYTKKSIQPSDLAGNPSIFDGNTGNMRFGSNENPLYAGGISFYRKSLGSSLSSADSELNAGRPVIAGVSCVSTKYGYKPSHYIVILKKENGKYIINDPYPENGYEKELNYSVCRIDSIIIK